MSAGTQNPSQGGGDYVVLAAGFGVVYFCHVVFSSRTHPWGWRGWLLLGKSFVLAFKQDLFRILTLNSYRSTFSESFSVLLPKPENFQLFPQHFKIGISSCLWVEISSGPRYCCPVPLCLLGHPAGLPELHKCCQSRHGCTWTTASGGIWGHERKLKQWEAL